MTLKKSIVHIIFLSLQIILSDISVHAQCNTPISNFPYLEGFEAGQGGWTLSAGNYWQWGAIVPGSKLIINSAGGGQKCWIVGGLSGSNYGSGNGYLQSPCFDLSSLANPEISLKVFWETERNYDGVRLEYSTDIGASWNVVGSDLSNSNCQGTNWYNNSSVRFLNNQPGWSGSVFGGSSGNCQSGSGSAQWLTAKHSLSFLNGATQVIFRFSFGAGTICNDYDGFALDDIVIQEAPLSVANFSYTCAGNNNVSFSNIQAPCQTSILWNFGDPLSGAQNQSAMENPSHQFSVPGQYHIRLTTTYPNNTTSVKDTTIAILSVTPNVIAYLLCNGDNNGIIEATATGGNSGSYLYSWNTNPPVSGAQLSGLSAGNYTVTVSAPSSCSASATVSLVQPSPIQINTQVTNATCSQQNGAIRTNVSGGNLSYTYLWSNNQTTANAVDLGPGNYQLTVADINGCSASVNNLMVANIDIPALPSLGADTTICPGQSLILNPGNFISYLWQDMSISNTYSVTQTGNYAVKVQNTSGCWGTDTIQVNVDCSEIYFPSAFTPDGDGLNDTFGPLGNLGGLVIYELQLFNRWGQRIFYSINPLDKWNGYFMGKKVDNGTYVWKASYKLSGRPFVHPTGTLLILK